MHDPLSPADDVTNYSDKAVEDAISDVSEEDTPAFAPSGALEDVLVASDDDPDDIVEPDPPRPAYSFDQACESLREAFKCQGWTEPMIVQRKAIPYLLAGQDLIVQSRTGSGKTGAFMIPLVEVSEIDHAQPQALVLVPTRELALQVGREAEILGGPKGVRTVVVYGGVGYEKQIDGLKDSHIVVGTPGRIIDLILRGIFRTQSIRDLVLDEADEMLSMGFYPDIARIRQMIPKDRCTYLFSATITEKVRHLAREFMQSPAFLSLSQKKRSVDNISHRYVVAGRMSKERVVLDILEHDLPDAAFVFCNTKRDVAFLVDYLRSHGLSAEAISGDLSQAAREKVMDRFRRKAVRFLVATDVAARGIDISDIPCVILYDQPAEPDVYVHRSGRTARAGKIGVAWSVVTELEELSLKVIGRRFGIRFEKCPPFDDERMAGIYAQRLDALLARAQRDANRAVRRVAERLMPATERLVQESDLRLGLALVLSRVYREEFGGQSDATLHGRELHGTIAETGGNDPLNRAPRRDGGGGRPRRRRR